MLNIKTLFDYRKKWKNQKNKNKRLRKKVNKLSKSISEELKLDITNEEIRKLRVEINDAEKKAKEYEERIYNTIKKIEHYKKYCGYDETTIIHDKELNELLKILEGEEINNGEKI